MLVLSRKKDETIQIGDDITVTVNKILGNRVVLGITAPPEINIARSEIYEPRSTTPCKFSVSCHQDKDFSRTAVQQTANRFSVSLTAGRILPR